MGTKAIVEAGALQAVAVGDLDRVDPGLIQGLGDLPGLLHAVLVTNGVAAVAQGHVGDVDFLGWRHGVSSPQAATASVASMRSAICSAVRRPALVMMSRLPA